MNFDKALEDGKSDKYDQIVMKYHEMLYFTLMFFFFNDFSLLTIFDWEAEEQAMHGFCMQMHAARNSIGKETACIWIDQRR